MNKQIFINVPVTDLQKSFDFYTSLGFSNNPQFSDESGKCMAWSDSIFVMIMTHEKFQGFSSKPISDSKATTTALFSLSVTSLQEVNAMVESGIKAGGSELGELRDYGFMQQRTIEDLDGHTWEIFCMDMSKFSAEEVA